MTWNTNFDEAPHDGSPILISDGREVHYAWYDNETASWRDGAGGFIAVSGWQHLPDPDITK